MYTHTYIYVLFMYTCTQVELASKGHLLESRNTKAEISATTGIQSQTETERERREASERAREREREIDA